MCSASMWRAGPTGAIATPSADLFHDPFVLFGFLAGCTKTVEFSTQVLILAQRQAVLVAKQAASLDVLCGGRFRLGVGVGWNPVEFTGLNENFQRPRPPLGRAGRGHASPVGRAACHIQRQVPHHRGRRHQSAAAETIYPDLVRRPRRRDAATAWSNGATAGCHWTTHPVAGATAAIAKLHGYAEEAGRDPASIGIDTRVTVGIGSRTRLARDGTLLEIVRCVST